MIPDPDCDDPDCILCRHPDCPACREEREPLVYRKDGTLKYVAIPEIDLVG